MREIVHIQGGQCGNQIGAKFWEVRVCFVLMRSGECLFDEQTCLFLYSPPRLALISFPSPLSTPFPFPFRLNFIL